MPSEVRLCGVNVSYSLFLFKGQWCHVKMTEWRQQGIEEVETVYSLQYGKTDIYFFLKGSFKVLLQSLRRRFFWKSSVSHRRHSLGVMCDGRASVLDPHKANLCLVILYAACTSYKLQRCCEKNRCAEQSRVAMQQANIHIQSAHYIDLNYAWGGKKRKRECQWNVWNEKLCLRLFCTRLKLIHSGLPTEQHWF